MNSFHVTGNDTGVTTTPEPLCQDFDLRLANPTFSSDDGALIVVGVVETCISGSYFSICDTNWDDVDAQLTCNGLGYIAPFFRKFMQQIRSPYEP